MNSIYEHSDVCMHNSYTTKCVTPRNKQHFRLSSKEEMGASLENNGLVGVDTKASDLNDWFCDMATHTAQLEKPHFSKSLCSLFSGTSK